MHFDFGDICNFWKFNGGNVFQVLPDDEIIEHIYNGCDAEQIARIMNSDINLVALKVASLNQQGYAFRQIEHNSTFLK